MTQELRLGTRGSQLALWQANTVAARIAAASGVRCRIVIIKTAGDRLQDAPLSQIGGKRLFVKEIEDALLAGDVDLAVHSSKDMPAVPVPGLAIAGVLPREDPRDALVAREPVRLEQVHSGDELKAALAALTPAGASGPVIGTGSVRRIAQLVPWLPTARFTPIRGNLDTRLRKLDSGEYDAIVLAAAGLRRLGFASRISAMLPPDICLPAPGQGIVAVEVRIDDTTARQAVAAIDDQSAAGALRAERALVEALGGGCQTPVGALATIDGDRLELTAAVVSLDGSRTIRGRMVGTREEAAALGARLGAQLLGEGADEILADAHRQQTASTGAESA